MDKISASVFIVIIQIPHAISSAEFTAKERQGNKLGGGGIERYPSTKPFWSCICPQGHDAAWSNRCVPTFWKNIHFLSTMNMEIARNSKTVQPSWHNTVIMHTIVTQIIADLNTSNFAKYLQNTVRNCWIKEKEKERKKKRKEKKWRKVVLVERISMNLWLVTSIFHLMAVYPLLRTVFRAQTITTHYLSM
jgi:hypothetical protein